MSARAASPLGVAAWGLVLTAVTRLVEIVFANYAMPATIGQALVIEWGTARLGVTWTDPRRLAEARGIAVFRRAVIGVVVGLAAAAAVFAVLKMTGSILIEKAEEPQLTVVLFGLATASFHAMRDELLHHGVVLRALADFELAAPKIVACGLTSAGAALGAPGMTPSSVIASGLLGMILGALWLRDRGAWQAWAAHSAWLFATTSLLSGTVLQTKVTASAWTGENAGVGGGYAAALALAPLAIFALWSGAGRGKRHISPRPRDVG